MSANVFYNTINWALLCFYTAALGWSSLALVLISLPSFLALSLVPLLPPSHLRTLLCPMGAMAVGTLCGDALLHLLPHVSTSKLWGQMCLSSQKELHLIKFGVDYRQSRKYVNICAMDTE